LTRTGIGYSPQQIGPHTLDLIGLRGIDINAADQFVERAKLGVVFNSIRHGNHLLGQIIEFRSMVSATRTEDTLGTSFACFPARASNQIRPRVRGVSSALMPLSPPKPMVVVVLFNL
jgi:hypothetical protein